jgi:AcrR family transcriptional regulator
MYVNRREEEVRDRMGAKRLTRQQSKLQTQERLLEAASQVFSRRGFDAASVDEIAEEAGYSKGAVYSNFASKEELFLTLLDRHLEAELQSVIASFEQASQRAGDEGQERSFVAQLQERRTWNVLTLEFFLYALRHPSAQQQLAERYRAARHEIAARLQSIMPSKGAGADTYADYVSWALIALGLGLALQGYLEPDGLPVDLYASISGRLLEN